MDKDFIRRTNKRVKVLGALKTDLNKMAGEMINKIEDPVLKAQVNEAKQAAMKGDKSPAEAILRNLKTK